MEKDIFDSQNIFKTRPEYSNTVLKMLKIESPKWSRRPVYNFFRVALQNRYVAFLEILMTFVNYTNKALRPLFHYKFLSLPRTLISVISLLYLDRR